MGSSFVVLSIDSINNNMLSFKVSLFLGFFAILLVLVFGQEKGPENPKLGDVHIAEKSKVNSTGLPDRARNSRVWCVYCGSYYYWMTCNNVCYMNWFTFFEWYSLTGNCWCCG